MAKMSNEYGKECLERYKYLAKLGYRNRLIGKISKCLIHDISTPLSVLSGSVKLLEDSKLNKKEISNVKKSALNSLVYLENILDNSFMLLTSSDKKRKFSGNCVVRKILLLVKSRLKKSKIVKKIDLKSCGRIYGNESFFARAVLNILINAIEELESNKKEKKIIEINSETTKNMYILRIKDNGMGIEKKVLESIQKREFSMKGDNHLGLGFIFVFDIIQNHFQGFLEIESVRGNSTTVIFKILL